jgi:hypothetical protein
VGSVGLVAAVSRNYGNRLQTFALRQAMLALGHETTVITFTRPYEGVWRQTKADLRAIKRRLSPRLYHRAARAKDKVLNVFSEKFVQPRHCPRAAEAGLHAEYDAFVVGSDQVWNPRLGWRRRHVFLQFAEPRQRLAYAASIAISDLPTVDRDEYRRLVDGMAAVSVREDDAARLLRELTGRDIPVVLDPVLLLDPGEWLSLPEVLADGIPAGPFALTYFVGGRDTSTRALIEDYTQSHGLEILPVMGDPTEPGAKAISPTSFVHAIARASVVFTDSFHGAAFSLLMNTPVLLFQRTWGTDMNSRFDTLLGGFSMEACLYRPGLDIDQWRETLTFDSFNTRLAGRRDDSLTYLTSSLQTSLGAAS